VREDGWTTTKEKAMAMHRTKKRKSREVKIIKMMPVLVD